MIHAFEGQGEYSVKLLSGERRHRFGLNKKYLVGLLLDDFASAHSVLFVNERARRFGKRELIVAHLGLRGD